MLTNLQMQRQPEARPSTEVLAHMLPRYLVAIGDSYIDRGFMHRRQVRRYINSLPSGARRKARVVKCEWFAISV